MVDVERVWSLALPTPDMSSAFSVSGRSLALAVQRTTIQRTVVQRQWPVLGFILFCEGNHLPY